MNQWAAPTLLLFVMIVAAVTSAHISLSPCVRVCAKILQTLAERSGVCVCWQGILSDSKRVCLAMALSVMLLWGIRTALRYFSHHVSINQNWPRKIHPS